MNYNEFSGHFHASDHEEKMGHLFQSAGHKMLSIFFFGRENTAFSIVPVTFFFYTVPTYDHESLLWVCSYVSSFFITATLVAAEDLWTVALCQLNCI
jgi:hypothetical protein